MNKTDAIIVGAGLFGATIAQALFMQGRTITVIDDKRPMDGSRPSGGLMKPSWFKSFGPGVYDPALKMLDSIFGVETLPFDINIGLPKGLKFKIKQEDVLHVHPEEVLRLPPRLSFNQTATKVEPKNGGGGTVELKNGSVISAPLVVVAAGIWTKDLAPHVPVKPLQGASFYFRGSLPRGIIRPWAPYKQLVLHDEGNPNTVWGGDGSALKPTSWGPERTAQCLERVAGALPEELPLVETRMGYRPYTKAHKPCYFEKFSKGLYIATGGAKNGMIGAGWCAHRILEETS